MKDKNDIAIKVEHLTKSFKIPLESSNGLKQKLINTIKGRKGYRIFTPLSDISFEIKKGEFFGIVGRNGSGKSTLLKSIAGIYTIESGKVSVNGTLVPFIELGVGFNAELSGRENVYLNGALLGFSNKEMAAMYDEIVDFAELHDFMEERLKNYSSGMQVRLAFSIAIRAKGDILLLDEVLAVGDQAFQQKCFSYFHKLKEENKTVILVTHSMSSVERFCSRALLLEDGEVKKIGTSAEIAALYDDLFLTTVKKKNSTKDADKWKSVKLDAQIKVNNKLVNDVKIHEYFQVSIKLTALEDIEACNLGVNIRNEDKKVVFSTDTRSSFGEFGLKKGASTAINVSIDNIYTNGKYYLGAHLVDESKESDSVLYMNKEALTFNSHGVTAHKHSLVHPNYTIVRMAE
jgi:ABC-2 type transport system ATP-binding protein